MVDKGKKRRIRHLCEMKQSTRILAETLLGRKPELETDRNREGDRVKNSFIDRERKGRENKMKLGVDKKGREGTKIKA